MFPSESDSEYLSILSVFPQYYSLVLTGSNIKEYDITRMQFIIMLALARHKMLIMSKIADILSSSREQTTRAVEHLFQEGYVERLPDSLNRTHVLIQLTDKGKSVVEKCRSDVANKMKSLLEGKLSKTELDELNFHVSEIVKLLDKVM